MSEKANILIVEDESIEAQDLKVRLKNSGYTVSDVVATGRDAIESADKYPVNLVLMDIKLKGPMNGIEAAEKIQTQYDIPVVYLTAHADGQTLEKAKRIGPHGFILKPYEDRELLGVIETVLYKHRLDRELREKEAWLSTILMSIGDGVIATDQQGVVRFMNPVAEELSGWQESDAKAKPVEDIFKICDEQTEEMIAIPVDQVLQDGKTIQMSANYYLISKNKQRIPVDFNIAPIRDKRSQLLGTVLNFKDMTIRKQSEKEQERLKTQLRQAQRLETIGTLAGGIAHDLNNILTPIVGYAGLALEDITEDSPVYTYMEEINKAADRAGDLVKQILTFSRQVEQTRQPLDLKVIVKETLKLLKSTIPATITIKQYIKSDCGLVLADPSQIHQVLMNLCTNAYQAMSGDGGVLEVNMDTVELDEQAVEKLPNLKKGKHVCLTVKDTGHGMSAEVIERIFDPFFTTKSAGEGTGLGLSVVHGIIKAHEGEITVSSTVGQGSTFHIYFPTIKSKKQAKLAEREQTPVGDETILFVDDEVGITTMVEKALERYGYTVDTFTSSKAALNDFKHHPDKYDLVITDLVMPELTGSQLIKKIHAKRPDIPSVLITGYRDNITDKIQKQYHINEILIKPIVIHKLGKIIRQLLDENK